MQDFNERDDINNNGYISEDAKISDNGNIGDSGKIKGEDVPEQKRYSIMGKLALVGVCMMFSFLLTVQFKSVDFTAQAVQNNELMRVEELQNLLNKERDKSEALYNELLTYQNDLTAYRDEAASSGDYAALLADQLKRAELVAGITDVVGPGVTVTMTDSEKQITTDILADPNYYIIHDSDILSVINELRDAGAEALAINGERLLATSEIRCAGSIVSVNNNRYAAPYVITAIGDPSALESALSMRGGVVEQLSLWGIGIAIDQQDSIEIKGYKGGSNFKYASPSDGGASS